MKSTLLALMLLLAGCAGVPDPPGCNGVYRSLNPTQYRLQDTGHEAVQATLGAS